MRSFGPVALAAVVASVAIVSPAQAADPKKEAKKLIAKGDALFRKGDYEGALAQYQKAYETFQSPKIFFPMAQAEEKLGRDLEALAHYEQLLSDAGEELSESVKAETQTHIQEIEKRIAVVSFDVYPVGTTISIDDVEIGQAPLEKSTRLMPGPHKYTFAAEGYKAQEQSVELVPGDRPVINVKLKSSQSMVSTKPKPKLVKPKASATDDGGGAGTGTLYAGITFTAAFGVAATVTGLLAVSKHGIFTDPTKTADEREAARDSGQSLATVTDLLVIGTAAAGVFTIYWYYSHKGTTHREHRVKPAKTTPDDGAAPPVPGGEDDDVPPGMGASLLVSPYASEGGGGLVVMGSF